jgi:hypothetical protein
LKERVGDLASRASSDQSLVERAAGVAVEVAVAKLRLELAGLIDARARDSEARVVDLEAQRREASVELQVLKERVGDLASRTVFDQGQVDRAAEVAVARASAKLSETSERALEVAFETHRREIAVQLQALKEHVGDIASRPSSDQNQIDHAAATAVETAVARLRLGLDDLIEAQARVFDAQLADLKARLKGAGGKLPVAKAWSDGSVTYEGEIVTYGGAAWQAARDTAQAPGGADWLPIATSGRDSTNGRSIVFRGAYDMRDSYSAMDVVTYEGQSFIAARDNPSGIPGDDDAWLLIAARGVKGERGEPGKVGQRGHKGDRGPAGAKIEEWRLSREHFVAVPFYDDGTSGPPLRLRDLFQEFLNQTAL